MLYSRYLTAQLQPFASLGEPMEHLDDPWTIALIISLAFMAILTAYALRTYIRDFLILGLVLPRAAFKKIFGPPRR
jgi:hypothetical protein